MIGELRLRELVVVGTVVAAGLAATAVAVGNRATDDQFLEDQRHPPALRADEVERVVRTAPDPLTGKGSGSEASCMRRGSGPLGNPWSCEVRFASGKRVRLRVLVQQDGYYTGRYIGVSGAAASGCCIDLPGTR